MKRKIAGYFYVERTNLMKDLNQGDKLKCPQEAECRGHGDEWKETGGNCGQLESSGLAPSGAARGHSAPFCCPAKQALNHMIVSFICLFLKGNQKSVLYETFQLLRLATNTSWF